MMFSDLMFDSDPNPDIDVMNGGGYYDDMFLPKICSKIHSNSSSNDIIMDIQHTQHMTLLDLEQIYGKKASQQGGMNDIDVESEPSENTFDEVDDTSNEDIDTGVDDADDDIDELYGGQSANTIIEDLATPDEEAYLRGCKVGSMSGGVKPIHRTSFKFYPY